MLQEEIDEISDAFSEAWEEYFGQVMRYVPLSETTEVHPIYGEAIGSIKYDWENYYEFNGTFKEKEHAESGDMYGRNGEINAEITFVTKEFVDEGLYDISQTAIIFVKHRSGVSKVYNIISNYGKVQLGNNKVFTKLGVVEIPNFDWSDCPYDYNG